MEALIVWGFTSFATYLIGKAIATHEGAFSGFDHFRSGVERIFGSDSWVTRGVNCPYCVAFWASLVITFGLGGDWLKWLATCGLAWYLLATER